MMPLVSEGVAQLVFMRPPAVRPCHSVRMSDVFYERHEASHETSDANSRV